jgi:hypothetical protein
MKVDMSPEAVTRRLESMGELWELSVALMDSTRLPRENEAAAFSKDNERKPAVQGDRELANLGTQDDQG